MFRTSGLIAAGLFLPAALCFAADAKYTIKTTNLPPPKELAEPIRKLMGDHAVQLLDSKGTVLGEVWLRKELPVKGATSANSCAAYGPGFVKVEGTNSCMKIGGALSVGVGTGGTVGR